jgi:hypothetical protein
VEGGAGSILGHPIGFALKQGTLSCLNCLSCGVLVL